MGLGKYQRREKTNAGVLIALMAADVDKKIYLVGIRLSFEVKTSEQHLQGVKDMLAQKQKQ